MVEIVQTPSSQFRSKKPLRLVLDEPVLYIEDNPAMVRGEVIVNVAHETTIQGPIQLLFEAIQIVYPWAEIMSDRAIGKPKESRLHVIELSLMPPNTKGIMPAGIHRFPFEFPIPPTLPPTITITNRLTIFYRLIATLHKSKEADSFVGWARQTITKRKLVDISHLRLVRAINASASLPPSAPPSTAPSLSALSLTSTSSSSSSTHTPFDLWAQYNNRFSLDEQHDQLVQQCLGGRVCDNFSRPLHMLTQEHGVRYRLAVDRTAIALGTSLGLELVLQPTQHVTKIRSVYVTLEETRKYNIAMPRKDGFESPHRHRANERNKTLLKWAYAYPVIPYTIRDTSAYDSLADMTGTYDAKKNKTTLGDDYLHNVEECKLLSSLEQPFDQPHRRLTHQPPPPSLDPLALPNPMPYPPASELDHAIPLGEYFDGYFVVPVPPCGGLLHPSMNADNVKIEHWLRMVVTLEQEGHFFELSIESPIHMLDCRLVSDDEKQTILPAPPSYMDDNRAISSDIFWHQRQPITTSSQWGTCRRPCPCQIRAFHQKQHALNHTSTHNINTHEPLVQPEWGAPPLYTE
ncbi:hypothetical protein DM01DRAFT_1334171, partial [Hesseltinella vesiculosa]